ncbi:MAG TPA: hypothetical protein VFB43_05680 [Terracidiphilus sp.]|jgi:DNA-binding NarL/FixJ family response regulator|nr:hypothetical protein [Terracidiphilus sp.]
MNSEPGSCKLISICDDDGLRVSRELILRHEGFEVVSIASNAALNDWAQMSFDIAVICWSVPAERTLQILAILRGNNPHISVLRVHASLNRPRPAFAHEFDIPGNPRALLEAVTNLRGEMRRSA